MIRKATADDILAVGNLYDEAIDYEDTHIKYTSWKKGVYPTVETAKLGVNENALYVCEDENDGKLLAAVILDTNQPPEYEDVNWSVSADYGKVLVIHTLCVHPGYSGSGIGSAVVDFAKALAKEMNCVAVRLNTGTQNLIAARLYRKSGFYVVATKKILLNGKIPCNEQYFMEWHNADT